MFCLLSDITADLCHLGGHSVYSLIHRGGSHLHCVLSIFCMALFVHDDDFVLQFLGLCIHIENCVFIDIMLFIRMSINGST